MAAALNRDAWGLDRLGFRIGGPGRGPPSLRHGGRAAAGYYATYLGLIGAGALYQHFQKKNMLRRVRRRRGYVGRVRRRRYIGTRRRFMRRRRGKRRSRKLASFKRRGYYRTYTITSPDSFDASKGVLTLDRSGGGNTFALSVPFSGMKEVKNLDAFFKIRREKNTS